MKKILMILSVLLLTGCGNEVICTKKTTEEYYDLEQKIIFQVDDNDKVTSVETNYIMIFETEENANSYMGLFESLDEDYEINQSGNKINVNVIKNYEHYNQNKDKLKEELEKDNYSCK